MFAIQNIGFIQLLLIGGIGASALVGPFALSLFWKKASSNGFIAGVVVSQVVTAYLLASTYEVFVNGPTLKLWEIMAVGHLVSTLVTTGVSLAAPDDFAFEDIAQEESELLTDGGDEGGDGAWLARRCSPRSSCSSGLPRPPSRESWSTGS